MSVDKKALEIARRVHILNIGRGDDLKMAIEAYEAAKSNQPDEECDECFGNSIIFDKQSNMMGGSGKPKVTESKD